MSKRRHFKGLHPAPAPCCRGVIRYWPRGDPDAPAAGKGYLPPPDPAAAFTARPRLPVPADWKPQDYRQDSKGGDPCGCA